jgi:DNA transposition AAA+ family ATPase
MVRQLSDEVCEGLRGEVDRFLKSRPDLTPLDLAQHTTLSDSTVRSFVRGCIPGGIEVVRQISRVLEQARQGDILQPGRQSGLQARLLVTEAAGERVRRVAKVKNFYQTQTAKRIGEVLDFCAENSAIGVITADYGAGKTEAVAAWRRDAGRKVESMVYEFDDFTSTNKVDFISTLAGSTASGIATGGGQVHGGRIFRELCEHLRQNPCLLIFDQCETLRPRLFQIIRQIWDRTNEAGVGVVLLAAPILLARMNASKMADLGALMSRVGVWAPLAGISKQEMAAIAKQEGITDVDDAAFDLWWKATGGSMRRLIRTIDLLKVKHVGKRVTERTVTGIAGHLWGVNMDAAAA